MATPTFSITDGLCLSLNGNFQGITFTGITSTFSAYICNGLPGLTKNIIVKLPDDSSATLTFVGGLLVNVSPLLNPPYIT